MEKFEVVLAARVPQSSGFPLLTEVDRLVVDSVSYTDELNRPGTSALTCPLRAMSSAVKTRLSDLAVFPSEVWIYYGSERVWAGEIQTLGVADQAVSLSCVGLLGYTYRMGVTSDLVYTAVDQFSIAKGLVNHWQGQTFGNFGIDTTAIGLSGENRDRTYLRSELHNVGTRLSELGAVENGFDTWVDADTRELVLQYPFRGLDLSGSVFLDDRNIDSASIAISVAPGDLVSDGGFTGSSQSASGTGSSLYSARASTAVRTSYGRSWSSANFDGVSVQATLDGHGDAYLAARATQLFQPGVTVVPRTGCEINDVHAGDIVSYSFDAGLGLQSGVFRISKVSVSAAQDGKQRLGLEFV